MLEYLIGAKATEIPPVAESVDFGVDDYLYGQSFVGSHLEFDIYYVSGTMPFGLPTTTKNTWIHIEANGTYTVENIGLNGIYRMANLKLDLVVDMPMHDHETAFVNNGTGDDFAQNGVIGQSQRGPNQLNCVATRFLNSYLKKDLSAETNTNQMTFSLTYNLLGTSSSYFIHGTYDPATNAKIRVVHYSAELYIGVWGSDASQSIQLLGVVIPTSSTPLGSNHTISVSFDLSNPLSRKAVFDGLLLDDNVFTIYEDDVFKMSSMNQLLIGAFKTTYKANCVLGELWFDSTQIDVSEFWDSDKNEPIPVIDVMNNTGVIPLVALPLRADCPEKNYGSTGDFVKVMSNPVGARGASEFWARGLGIYSTGTHVNYIQKFDPGGILGNFTLIITAMHVNGSPTSYETFFSNGLGNTSPGSLVIRSNASFGLEIWIDGAIRYNIAEVFNDTKYHTIILGRAAGIFTRLFVDGLNIGGLDVGENVLPIDILYIGSGVGSKDWNGSVSFVTLHNKWVDVLDEAVRLRYFSGLGYPIDIQPAIYNGDIPNPAFYLPFNDPDDLGKDTSGNGNHFTVNGTVTQGADVNV